VELRHLRYFLAVAEERNFTQAAARVGIGQPPLSQQIRDLETEIGTPLFHRLPHGAELTEAGAAFRAAVERIPEQVANAVQVAQRTGRGEVGALRVGFTASAAMNPIVPATIRRFRHRHSDVELTLTESNSTALTAALREGGIDVAFIRPGAGEPEDLREIALPDEVMIAALPTGHRALASLADAPIELTALRDDAFVLTPRAVGPSLFDAAVEACEQAGFLPRLGQSAPQIASVLALVAAAEGVSIVPESMRQLTLGGVAYRAIADVRPIARLSLAHLRVTRSPTIRHFLSARHVDPSSLQTDS